MQKELPNRIFDVGIAEGHAVTFSAGMAKAGLKPYCNIYSSFLQRAYDNIIHDVALPKLPVVLCIDRAGISGADGETHQGVFDISYLSLIPNMTILAPKDCVEFREMLKASVDFTHPLAIRYPRAGAVEFASKNNVPLFSWETLFEGEGDTVTVLAVGERCLTLAAKALEELKKESKTFTLINARVVKPLDEKALRAISSKTVVTLEDNVAIGGFGAMVNFFFMQNEMPVTVKSFAYCDQFIEQGSVAVLQKKYGVDYEELLKYIRERI
jgi:1-deoxy-D-xylulose-5-phosphate synthase